MECKYDSEGYWVGGRVGGRSESAHAAAVHRVNSHLWSESAAKGWTGFSGDAALGGSESELQSACTAEQQAFVKAAEADEKQDRRSGTAF